MVDTELEPSIDQLAIDPKELPSVLKPKDIKIITKWFETALQRERQAHKKQLDQRVTKVIRDTKDHLEQRIRPDLVNVRNALADVEKTVLEQMKLLEEHLKGLDLKIKTAGRENRQLRKEVVQLKKQLAATCKPPEKSQKPQNTGHFSQKYALFLAKKRGDL